MYFSLHLNPDIQTMERDFKITIPKPCNENWDTMSPKDNGRFCMSCSKTVVDFTTMLPDEVQHFFIQNQNNRICGRFKNEQLENLIIQIPKQVLQTQTNYHKMFLLALFIAMGTTLFSCADKDGNKQKIDKVEIVEDSSIGKNIQVGDIKINKNDSVCNFPPPPPPPPRTVDHMQFVKGKMRTEKLISRTSGEVILIPQSDKIPSKNIDSSKIETKRN